MAINNAIIDSQTFYATETIPAKKKKKNINRKNFTISIKLRLCLLMTYRKK